MAAAEGPGGMRGRQGLGNRFVYDSKNTASPKLYVLQPWITDLLVNYEQLDTSKSLLAGQVLRVLSDTTSPSEGEAVQDATLQVSDGSCHIRVVITSEALQRENNHMQLRLSSLVCRIIVLQKYTVCFHEEARLEDCEFYLLAHQFIVLPLERQRLESFDGNQEPSVLQKKKELWLRSLTVKNVPSSEPSISQLIDAIGQNQLEVLKENAEECLDLRKPKEAPAAVMDEAPITQWEAKRKEEQSEDIFTVPVHTLVIPAEEEEEDAAAACEASKADADANEAASGKSGDCSTHTVPPSVVSQVSSFGSPASLESLEESLDNPWNTLPPMSLTLTSSDEGTCQHELSPKPQQDVAADSNTPDLLEPCSQDCTEGNLLGQPVQISSPSLLDSYGDTSLMENGTAQGPQLLGGSPAPLPSLSPGFLVLPSSHLQPLPIAGPHQEQADSSSTTCPSHPSKHSPPCARSQGGDAIGAKRKLLAGGGQTPPTPSGQLHTRGALWGRGREHPVITKRPRKSRKVTETRLRHGKELEEEEEEQVTPTNGPSSRPEQGRALSQYVKVMPTQYRYEAPSPELCERVRSVRISKAMLKWACWILTDGEVDS